MREKLTDILTLAGLGGVTYGLWQAYEPLAWIVGGIALVVIAYSRIEIKT